MPVTPGLRAAHCCLRGAAFSSCWGIVSGQRAHIGYETPGTPLYKPDSKVNQDIAEIGKFFPTDEGWIVLTTPDYPDPQSGIGPEVLRMTDDLGTYLVSRGDALAVVVIRNLAIEPLDRCSTTAFPNSAVSPTRTRSSAGNLWYMFWPVRRRARWSVSSPIRRKMTSSCIRVLLPDHTYSRLNRLRDDIEKIHRGAGRPRTRALSHVR